MSLSQDPNPVSDAQSTVDSASASSDPMSLITSKMSSSKLSSDDRPHESPENARTSPEKASSSNEKSTPKTKTRSKEKPTPESLVVALRDENFEAILDWMNQSIATSTVKDLRGILSKHMFMGTGDRLIFWVQLAVYLKRVSARYVFSRTLVDVLQDNHGYLDTMLSSIPLQDGKGDAYLAPFQKVAIESLSEMESEVVSCVLNEFDISRRMTRDQTVKYAKSLVESKRIKEAAAIVGFFKIHEHFSVEEILQPLITTRRFDAAEKYVSNQTELQKEMIKLVNAQPEGGYKAAGKLIKKFKLDMNEYPDIQRRMVLGNIRWIISSEKEEILDHFLKENLDYLGEAIKELVIRKHYSWALSVVKNFNVSGHYGPERLTLEELEKFASEDQSPLGKDTLSDIGKVEYLQLDESQVQVVIVDNERALALAEENLLQEGAIVGLDAEWKASFYDHEEHKAALLQASLDNIAFLFDLTYFASSSIPLISKLLADEKILKLGFAFSHDMTQLKRSFPSPQYLQDLNNYIDIAEMYYSTKYRNKPMGKQSLTGISLASVVKDVLNTNLSKKQQCSNWERRPLTKDQIHYASLDAHCLIECYHELHKRSLFSSEGSANNTDATKSPNVDRAAKKDLSPLNNEEIAKEVISLLEAKGGRDIRFLVDSSMGRLMRQLRVLGVDTESSRAAVPGKSPFIPERQYERELVMMAAKEERVILTRNQKLGESRHLYTHGFNEGLFVRGRVPCVVLQFNSSQEQLKYVIELFRIKINKEKLLSRCSKCNGDQFLELDKKQVVDRVPENILLLVNEFWECGKCHQIYWVGPQYSNTMDWWGSMATYIGDTAPEPADENPSQTMSQQDESTAYYHSKIHFTESGEEVEVPNEPTV